MRFATGAAVREAAGAVGRGVDAFPLPRAVVFIKDFGPAAAIVVGRWVVAPDLDGAGEGALAGFSDRGLDADRPDVPAFLRIAAYF
jgi:hypothetical protein